MKHFFKFLLPGIAMILFFDLLYWNTDKVSQMFETIGAFYSVGIITFIAYVFAYVVLYQLYKVGSWVDKALNEAMNAEEL